MATRNRPSEIEDVTPEVPDVDYDVTVPLDEDPDRSMATTDSFFDDRPATVNEIVDLGVVEIDQESETVIVRPIMDIGPVYYGRDRLIEMKKGRQYRVPQDIARYVRERKLDWNQQEEMI